jgi:hypothetical protein
VAVVIQAGFDNGKQCPKLRSGGQELATL